MGHRFYSLETQPVFMIYQLPHGYFYKDERGSVGDLFNDAHFYRCD